MRKDLIDVIGEMRRIDRELLENPPKFILIGLLPVRFEDFHGTARYKIWLQDTAIKNVEERPKKNVT